MFNQRKGKVLKMQRITERSIEDAAAWMEDPKNLEEQVARLKRAKRHILLDYPFLGDKAIRSKTKLSLRVPTAGTDGKSIEFNPLFAALLSFSFLIFVMAHEFLHIALGHHVRRGNRSIELWNMACDYVINRILVAAGLKIPPDALYDERFNEFSEEQIYSILQEEKRVEEDPRQPDGFGIGEGEGEGEGEGQGNAEPEAEDEAEDEAEAEGNGQGEAEAEAEGEGEGEGQGEGNGEGEGEGEGTVLGKGTDPSNNGSGGYDLPDASTWGEVADMKNDDGTSMDGEERSEELVKQQMENETARKIGDAIGKGGSEFSSEMERAFDRSRYRWEDELREFVQTNYTGEPESTWERGWRAGFSQDLYLPGNKTEGISRILVATDSSGSMWSELYDHALSQTEKIVNVANAEVIDWLQFDHEVQSVRTFEFGARFKNPTRSGHGGTEFAPVLEWIKQSRNQYDCIIVTTDMGLCDWHVLEAPDAPIIWCDVYGGSHYQSAPFGKTITVTK